MTQMKRMECIEASENACVTKTSETLNQLEEDVWSE